MVVTHTRYQSLAKVTPLSGVSRPTDRILVLDGDGGPVVVVIDAGAQGPGAARSVEQAEAIVRRVLRDGVAETFVQIHRALADKPGVSLAVGVVDSAARRLTFSGVGKVYGVLAGGDLSETLQSEPGTLGVGLPRVPAPQVFPFHPGDLFCLAADGIVDVWDLAAVWRHRTAALPTLLQRVAGSPDRLPDDAAIVFLRAE